jgi:hypothetical protein
MVAGLKRGKSGIGVPPPYVYILDRQSFSENPHQSKKGPPTSYNLNNFKNIRTTPVKGPPPLFNSQNIKKLLCVVTPRKGPRTLAISHIKFQSRKGKETIFFG